MNPLKIVQISNQLFGWSHGVHAKSTTTTNHEMQYVSTTAAGSMTAS